MSETDEIRRLGIDQRVYAVSHPGGRERNEDSYLAKKWNSGWIFAVADGLGGHRAGEIASRCAIQSLLTSFSHQEGFPTEGLLRRAFEEAHENIRSRAKGNWEGMGTTLVTACVTDMTAIFANTGDSRAYVIRDKVIYRTRDHSVVQDLVAGGALTEEQARLHPMKNLLTAALGIDFMVDVDTVLLSRGDIILLSSDGFHDFIPENRMIQLLRTIPFPKSGEALLEEVLQQTTDNVTFILYRVF